MLSAKLRISLLATIILVVSGFVWSTAGAVSKSSAINIFSPVSYFAPGEELKVLICAVRWDDTFPLVSQEKLQTILKEVNKYYLENSFGKFGLKFGFSMRSNIYTGDLPTSAVEEIEATTEWCGGEGYVNTFDVVVIMPSYQKTDDALALTRSYIGEDTYARLGIDAQFIQFTKDEVNTPSKSLVFRRTFIHEIGHVLRAPLLHAGNLECGSVPFADGCEWVEYGNPFDVMGFHYTGGHMSGWFKSLMGWVTVNEIRRDVDTRYRIYPLEEKTTGTQLIKIGPEGDSICIDYRRPVGYDNFALKAKEYSEGRVKDLMEEDMALPEEGVLFVYSCKYEYDISDAESLSLINPAIADIIDTTPGSDPAPELMESVLLGTFLREGDVLDSYLKEGDAPDLTSLGIEELSFTHVTSSYKGKITHSAIVSLKTNMSFAH